MAVQGTDLDSKFFDLGWQNGHTWGNAVELRQPKRSKGRGWW